MINLQFPEYTSVAYSVSKLAVKEWDEMTGISYQNKIKSRHLSPH
jgi:hypothetical protein